MRVRPRAPPLLHAPARSGRSDTELLAAFRVLTGYINGFAQAELAGPLSHARGETTDAITDRVRALPSRRFPQLIEIAAAAVTSTPEAEFQAGLDIILNGLDRR